MATTKTSKATTVYSATAMLNGKTAGHVCYGRTKEECEAKARSCSLSVKIKRERMDAESIAALEKVGKL